MAVFTVNPTRVDPYKNFKFRLKWAGRYIAGVNQVSELEREPEAVKHRPGGDPSAARKIPGQTDLAQITLQRGVTHDAEFQAWANTIWQYPASTGSTTSLADHRKDLQLECYNEAGQLIATYTLSGCWVTQYTALPDLDRNTNGIAIEAMVLQAESWKRGPSVGASAEPS